MTPELVRFAQGLSASLLLAMAYVPAALGFYIALRCLRFPDLTVEGAFVWGQVVSAAFICDGSSPGVALAVAAIGGSVCGLLTALQNVKLRVPAFVCGIVTTFIVISVNYKVIALVNKSVAGATAQDQQAGPRSEINLNSSGVFEWAMQADRNNATFGEYRLMQLFILSLFVMVVVAVVFLFLRSKLGLQLRAFGVHRRTGSVYRVNAPWAIYLGLAVSNALVAWSGALFTQINRLASIDLGANLLIPLLAAIVLGEFFVVEVWQRIVCRLFYNGKVVPPLLSRPLAMTLAPCVGYLLYTTVFILISVVVLPDYTKLDTHSKYWLTAAMILLILIYRRFIGQKTDPGDVI
ncbi:MAG: hypothetical protein LLG01_15870 [Planctomycetaceae bacterium]|nr:hypothetical protein [Planctomycetaceae bacterium]